MVLVLESLHQATNIPEEWQDTIVTLQYLKVGIRMVITLGTRHQSALNQEHVKIWHIYFAATYFLFHINRENWRENWKMFNIGFIKNDHVKPNWLRQSITLQNLLMNNSNLIVSYWISEKNLTMFPLKAFIKTATLWWSKAKNFLQNGTQQVVHEDIHSTQVTSSVLC